MPMLGLCVRLFCLPVFLRHGDWCLAGVPAVFVGCFAYFVSLVRARFSWGVHPMEVGGCQYSGHHRPLARSHR